MSNLDIAYLVFMGLYVVTIGVVLVITIITKFRGS